MVTTFKVTTFDVWGHAPSQCEEYGCPCAGHDSCECHYEINDVFSAGTLEVEGENPTDEQIWHALCENGFAQGDFDQAEFEDMGETSFHINEKSSGLPTFGLERVES